MKSNVDEVLNGFKEVKEAIEKLFYIVNNNQAYCMNLDELIEYEDSPDGRMYRDEFRNILVRLLDIQIILMQ